MPITLDGTLGITTPSYGGADAAEYLVPVTSFKNRIINGAMVFDQRGLGASVTATTSNLYTLDRWQAVASVGSKYTVQQNAGSVTPPAGFINYLGVTSSSAYSIGASDYFNIVQYIEGTNTADLAWGTANAKTITFSFWVRSSLTGTFGGSLRNANANRSYPFSYTINSANTWEQKSITVTGDTSGTWNTDSANTGISLFFGLGVGSNLSGTADAWVGANRLSSTGATSVVGTNGATWYITGVQLEVGTNATSFDARSYGTELQLCQRYCMIFRGGTYGGFQIAGSVFSMNLSMPVPMRTTPSFSTTITDSNFVVASPNANQWAMYVQNSGYSSYSGSINTLSLNSMATNSTQYSIGTYSCTLGSSFTGFLLGSNNNFSFTAEL